MVIRPTPGAGDRTSLGLDLMAALGKNPDLLRQDKLGSGTWELAGAWLLEAGFTDVFLDRAHTLPIERIRELLELSIALKASLWLIWGGMEPTAAVETLIADAGFRGRVDTFRPHGDSTIATDELHGALPLPDGTADRDRILTLRVQVWPVLPSVDFPTFRAACRRYLSPSVFARVDAVYLEAADRVDTWISDRIRTLIDERSIPTDTDLAEQAIARAHQLVQRQAQWEEGHEPGVPDPIGSSPPAAGAFEWAGRPRPIQLRDLGSGQLTAWLRDTQLGPADADGLALITLRATQAALLRHGLLLAWNPGPLGPDPNARLRGDLTRLRANALYALGRTEHAAVTALSLHLNHPPTVFGCWRCGDVAPDGSTLRGGPHRHRLGNWAGDAGANDPCATTVRVPEPARRLIVAHLAYRRIQGAGADDPFFINTRDAARSPASMLRSRAATT